jgi:hypothetical protein
LPYFISLHESAKKNFLKEMWRARLNSQNPFVKVIALLVFILCIYPSYTTTEVRTFSYEEKVYYPGTPRITDLRAYDDGTVVVRIVRANANTTTTDLTCYYEILSLRIINLDGTVIEKDIKLEGVQQSNYCKETYYRFAVDHLRYELIRTNQILVIYHNNFNHTNADAWGMIIDFDGNVLDRTYFGTSYFDINNLGRRPFKLQLNLNIEKGFIIFDELKSIRYSQIPWQQYKIEPDGKFKMLTSGTIELNVNGYIWYNRSIVMGKEDLTMMSTVDEGYAYVYQLGLPGSEIVFENSIIATALIGYNKTDSATVLLYNNHIRIISGTTVSCNIEYVGIGQYCSFSTFTTDHFISIKINFLSSGSVASFNVTDFYSNGTSLYGIDSIKSLPYGGSLVFESAPYDTDIPPESSGILDYSVFTQIHLLTENGTIFPLGLNKSDLIVHTGENNVNIILPNNTLLIPQIGLGNTWELNVIDLPKFMDRDHGYFNTNVESTFPKINDSVKFSDTTNISIDFYDSVKVSDGKLSIYQMYDQRQILRQSTSCIGATVTQCTLENDDKRVIVKLLDSTLSKSDGIYFVRVDNNFVKDRVHEEPLLGIKKDIWYFIIEDKIQYPIISSTSGLLRLTVEGTDKLKNLSNDERKQFFNTLLDELADVVLIPRERLSKNSKEQIDPDSKGKQLLISIKINEAKDHYEKDVDSVIQNLNNMMANSEQTLIGQGNTTQYLDSNFGFKPDRKL